MTFVFSILLKQTFALIQDRINTQVFFRYFMNYLQLNIFIHMCVFAHACMHALCAIYVQVPQRPEENISFTAAGVSGGCALAAWLGYLGWWKLASGPPQRQKCS